MRCLYALFLMLGISAYAQARNLAEILREGVKHDPDIAEARANERVADSQLAQSKATLLPTVSLKADQRLLDTSQGRQRSFDPTVQMQWNLLDFGKRKSRIARDRFKKGYFAFKVNEVKEEFLYQLASDYLDALKAKMSLMVAQNNLKRHQSFLQRMATVAQYDPGRRSELTQVRSKTLKVQESIAQYQRAMLLSLNKISVYLPKAAQSTDLSNPFASLSPALLEKNYAMDIKSLKQNPSYQAQRKELESLKADMQHTQNARWPDVNLGSDLNRDGPAVYLSLHVDLLNFNQSAAVREKAGQVSAAKARLEKVEQNLKERVAASKLQMHEDTARIKIADQQIRATKQLAADYEDQFSIAKKSLLDVLSAYEDVASIEQSKVNIQHDLMRAKLEYLSAVGGISRWAGVPMEPVQDNDDSVTTQVQLAQGTKLTNRPIQQSPAHSAAPQQPAKGAAEKEAMLVKQKPSAVHSVHAAETPLQRATANIVQNIENGVMDKGVINNPAGYNTLQQEPTDPAVAQAVLSEAVIDNVASSDAPILREVATVIVENLDDHAVNSKLPVQRIAPSGQTVNKRTQAAAKPASMNSMSQTAATSVLQESTTDIVKSIAADSDYGSPAERNHVVTEVYIETDPVDPAVAQAELSTETTHNHDVGTKSALQKGALDIIGATSELE